MANRVRRRALEAAQQAAEVQVRQLFKAHKSTKLKKLFGAPTRKYLREIQYNTLRLPEELRHPKVLKVCALMRRFARRAEIRQYYPVYQSPYDLAEEVVAQPKLLPVILSASHSFLFWIHEGQIIRPIQSWSAPKSTDPFKVIWSFAEHCYIRYPHQVPHSLRKAFRCFFYQANLRSYSYWAFHLNMLLHQAQGKGVHTYHSFNQFPIPSKANAFLLQAPRHLNSFNWTLYWACLRANGISKARIQKIWEFFLDHPIYYFRWGKSILRFLAKASFSTEIESVRTFYIIQQLMEIFTDNFPEELPSYYQSVINFFLRYINEIGEAECQPWLRYIIQKREEEQKELKMKGRTPRSFRRQYLAFTYAQQAAMISGDLPRSTLQSFHQETAETQYKIIQLTTDYELYLEGYWMGNCVHNYAEECQKGESTIWSLKQLDANGEWVSKVTIEVEWHKKIIQAFARFNLGLNKQQESLLKAWAKREKLACAW